MLDFACDSFRPKAVRTWLGSSALDVQAEPVEAETPFSSSSNSSVSASIPGIETLILFGSLFVLEPFSFESGILVKIPLIN